MVAPPPRDLQLLRRILATARDEVAGWGGELVFVYLPGSERYKQDRANDEMLFDRRAVLDLVRDLGLPVVDFAAVLARDSYPLSIFPQRYYPHYVAEGYARVADTIAEHLAPER